jgi:acetyl esterase
VLATLGAAALIAGVVVCTRIVLTLEAAGTDVSVLSTLRFNPPATALPDAEPTYLQFEGRELKLSVYRPKRVSAGSAAPVPVPVLVHVHGGGWVDGSPAERSVDLRWFADQGYLVFSVTYSLSDEKRHFWNVVHGQIGCALSWMGRHAADYGGDANRLSLTGDSAGGNLVINTAYLAARGTLRSACPADAPPPIRAVIGVVPAVDLVELANGRYSRTGPGVASMVHKYTGGTPEQFPERYASVDSGKLISAGAPPTLMFSGEADHLVPIGQAKRFAAQAKAAGIELKHVVVPHHDHFFGGADTSLSRQAYRQLSMQWLGAHGQSPGSAAAGGPLRPAAP